MNYFLIFLNKILKNLFLNLFFYLGWPESTHVTWDPIYWPGQPRVGPDNCAGNRGDPPAKETPTATRQRTGTRQFPPLPSPVSQIVPVSFATVNKSLRRGRNHHKQSSNGGTVGVPIRPKYEVLDTILIRGR